MAALADYFSPQQLERARRIAADSVGCDVKVKADDGFTYTGVIDTCEPAYAGFHGRSVHVVFSVDVLCGVNKTRRNFKLRTLPR